MMNEVAGYRLRGITFIVAIVAIVTLSFACWRHWLMESTEVAPLIRLQIALPAH